MINVAAIVRAVLPAGLKKARIPVNPDDKRPWGSLYVAVEDMPAAGLRAGDVLLFGKQTKRDLRQIRGSTRVLARRDVGALLDSFDSLQFAGSSWSHRDRDEDRTRRSVEYGHKQYVQGRAFREDTTGILIIRPYGAVSEPIAANDSDAALFELLASVGCSLPPA